MSTANSNPGEPREERESQGGGSTFVLSGGDERSEPESQTEKSPAVGHVGEETGGVADAPARSAGASVALPCLFETLAPDEKKKEEKGPLPGPRKKQADALTENIKWLAETFGPERIGFLTLTLGDKDAGGRFRNLRDRKKAQRRFHSLMTHELSRHYICGVTVTERHKNQGIHFHLAVVCQTDIRGNIDFAACFPPKDARGKPMYKPDYSTANEALKREWAYLRHICKRYGFGRHQLQPMRENAEALGRYLGEYLSKDWDNRLPEDKGARCLRYFGHWSKTERKKGEHCQGPPNHNCFGWMTPRARAWRELVKQVVIVLKYKGAKITEETIKDVLGPKWAWKMGRLFEAVRFEIGDWQDEAVRAAIEEHNSKVQARWLSGGGDPARSCWWHVTEITLDHLRPSPAWKKQMAELQLAKECEAEIRKGLKKLNRAKREKEMQLQLLRESLADMPVKKDVPPTASSQAESVPTP